MAMTGVGSLRTFQIGSANVSSSSVNRHRAEAAKVPAQDPARAHRDQVFLEGGV
jgi:hypothetical protein